MIRHAEPLRAVVIPVLPRYLAAAAISFRQPARINGAEAKGDAEVKSL